MKFLKPSILLLLLIATSVNAQTNEDEAPMQNGTIDQQFEYVLEKSGNFRGTNGMMYEAVNRSMFLTLQAHTIDSLSTLQKNLEAANKLGIDQKSQIEDLQSKLANTQTELDETNAEKNSMSLFGIQMSKGGYNGLMWTIIGGLLILLGFFIMKFKNSNSITLQARQSLAEVEEEFEEHRKRALEREQKVRRQLQDEINKQKKAK
ncbi:tRNA (guanine-N1)-methyltransferase [Gaetbulibacter aestuarii]|uniref:tRNA (Guanine-N1)-methyltransferase n=1 Tax=Gaetbulibacter aestuarii TaxID=1502358 RepID=A0ABW7N1M2_9FLAO